MTASARYQITHRTSYRYPEPVALCQNQLRMKPRNFSNVECHRVDCRIGPEPDAIEEHTDYFGNQVVTFAIESVHRQLDVTVESDVTVRRKDMPADTSILPWDAVAKLVDESNAPEWWTTQEFSFDSPRVARGECFAAYARSSFSPHRSVADAAVELTKRINQDFKYDTAATDVHTSTPEVFDLRAGVCQDFAHVLIACLRSLGLPARYVSGYLRTVPPPGKPRLIGADESHAWASVYAGEPLGWLDLDPTNACITSTDHIPVCVGRDYGDVSPMRGVVLGGGDTQLTVSVDVRPIQSRL